LISELSAHSDRGGAPSRVTENAAFSMADVLPCNCAGSRDMAARTIRASAGRGGRALYFPQSADQMLVTCREGNNRRAAKGCVAALADDRIGMSYRAGSDRDGDFA
jgi:hypothetical protein